MKRLILTAAALFAISTAANAAILQVAYTGIISGAPFGPPSPGVIGGSATWTYDDVSGDLTGTGTVTHTFSFGPNPIFTHNLTDLSITGLGVASASAYTCINGAFASAGLFRDLCAGYGFGPNQLNESTVGPNGVAPLTLGGDDVVQGAPQTLANDFDMLARTYSAGPPLNIGDTIKINKPGFTGTVPGTFQLTFQVVPVPAAVWLFGSALGLMGLARRQKAAA